MLKPILIFVVVVAASIAGITLLALESGDVATVQTVDKAAGIERGTCKPVIGYSLKLATQSVPG